MVQAEEITIVADEWCPFNCEPNSKAPGFMIEIATEIFSKAGHSVNYSTMDWDEALTAVRKGEFKAIVGAANEDAPDSIFVAFSPADAKSKDYAQILGQGMDELRRSGKLKAILSKYGMEDWQ